MEVEYDPQLGYPRRAHIDGDLSIEDDELEIRASLLHVAGQTSADPVEPSADTAAVLAGVAAHVDQRDDYDVLHVVDRLGRLGDHQIGVSAGSRPVTADERAAIEAGLSPRAVTWVADLHAVIGDNGVIAEGQAVITINSERRILALPNGGRSVGDASPQACEERPDTRVIARRMT